MLNGEALKNRINTNADDAEQFKEKHLDALISVGAAFLSMIFGGIGLFTLSVSLKSFPIVIIALILWGFSCAGIGRIYKKIHQNH